MKPNFSNPVQEYLKSKGLENKPRKIKRIGVIRYGSWICRLGCYHEVGDHRCTCECHNHLYNVIKEREFLK